MNEIQVAILQKQLEEIKKLVILLAMVNGAESSDIAKVLGISMRTVQRLMPTKSIKKKA